MKQYAEHDRVGLCHPLRGDQMYVRVFSGGYPYLRNGAIVRSDSINPIYSYGKNFEKNDKKFAMFVWTTNNDQSAIDTLFNSLLDKVDNDKIDQIATDGSFIYL